MSGAVKELGLEAYSESRYGFDRFGWSPLMALRQGRFKLILAPRPELYDLASDPDERTNLYGQRAALATALTRRLEEIEQPAEAQRAADVPAMDSDTRARLAALGYVSASRHSCPIDAGARLRRPERSHRTLSAIHRAVAGPERTPMKRAASLSSLFLAVACGGDKSVPTTPTAMPLASSFKARRPP